VASREISRKHGGSEQGGVAKCHHSFPGSQRHRSLEPIENGSLSTILAFLKPLCLDASPRRTHWLVLDASFTLVESLLG
jgi:hypothetical protein